MSENKKVFVSYSHDSKHYKERVRSLVDVLITDYGIDVVADFYEEDNPTGGLLTSFMQSARQADRIICILTPGYKLKANEGQGGVGYESAVITSELYQNFGSNRVIPIIIDSNLSLNDCAPNFLTAIRKTILRKNYDNDELFMDEVARVVHEMPKNPKPALGKNKLLFETRTVQNAEDIDVSVLINNHKRLFDSALFYAKGGDEVNFRNLFRKVKNHVFRDMKTCRKKWESNFRAQNEVDLPLIMDEFINTICPLFLIAFAGYLSANEKFSNQQGLLIDLLSVDEWWQQGGLVVIRQVPELLAYVYHHLYGSLVINNDRIENILKIFMQKIPSDPAEIKYKYLYQVTSVTGFVESLGRNCFSSFNYLLSAYKRWNWLEILFSDEEEFKNALVSYQMAINILFYFQSIKNNTLATSREEIIGRSIIPPSFAIARQNILHYCYHFMIKQTNFFKAYLNMINLSEAEALNRWNDFLKIMGHFNEPGAFYLSFYPTNFMQNLLK